MKNTLVALSLGLGAALAGTSAFANTGTINFEGKITASTCPIEVINPGDGSVGSVVKMGSVDASRFQTVGDEHAGKSFALRLTDNGNCGLVGNDVAKVTFNGRTDTVTGQYFGLIPGSSSAQGVAISIRDKSGNSIAPGSESVEYDLIQNGTTDMLFDAFYRSIASSVTAGAASTDVQFIVAIN